MLRYYSTRSRLNLRRPVFPVKQILASPNEYAESVRARQVSLYKNQSITDLVDQYQQLANLRHERTIAGAERNAVVAEVKRTVATLKTRDVLPPQLREASEYNKRRIAAVETKLAAAEAEFDELLESVPNLTSPAALAVGGDFTVVRQSGEPEPQADSSLDHVEIGSYLGILDIPSASRVSGGGNAYLVGAGALLEQALVQYALKKCTTEFGFTAVSPPALVRADYNAACGFRPRGEATQIYEVVDSDLCLAGTAEIPLASQLALQTLDSRELPLKRCGAMRSFRAEAGSRGTDTRGLYRLHEFTKVEMFLWSLPSQSPRLLDDLVQYQEQIFSELLGEIGVPLRTINVAPTDLGNPAYQKYDIEAWMPGRGEWGEISSASNCQDFQARRLHTKYTADGESDFVHTLNGTALAVPRIIVAILENGFDKNTKKVRLPSALWPYVGKEIQKAA